MYTVFLRSAFVAL
jgi:hypothetical protein